VLSSYAYIWVKQRTNVELRHQISFGVDSIQFDQESFTSVSLGAAAFSCLIHQQSGACCVGNFPWYNRKSPATLLQF
jgi:hypothetical protein